MALLSYEFMRRAFLAAIFIAGIAPMLGVFLVIRRQSLMADTLSHVSLAGVALGFFLNLNPSLTTLLIVVIAAIILEYLRTLYRSYSEISIAILMSGGLALALVLMNLSGGNSATSIQSYLFGSIVTITQEQVWILGFLFLVVFALFFLFKRPMYILTFDEDTAHVDGLPVRVMSMLFNVLTGVAIAMMIPIAGALLISAIMVLPAAISMRLGKSFNAVILISVVIGMIGMMSGLTSSFYLDTPPGATITLVFIALFLVINLIKRLVILVQRKQRLK
ncbi:metal ABC transporter permease [Enterococcus casseliflavus]|uniref:metal ABC transporter permease n=1 Tax=Enterococcus casseliflavus TaxID=37734 RepID=UPI0009854DD3|nr:metal ABC transporter permease [Enterococcus casseliflavus]MEB8400830.1 metal ABC transporter permease [Enterococcus casseliflavus]MUN75041.1 iron chelate uptake ABC transporter family permease subunit [Enterococcus casseliflavus]MUN98165.1 iron chelate uptake ABC transporter family permease subunit [Enterococcus casseliflavus]OOG24628.1 zinc ABC transporter permease [Enterococcus casseliflavus]QQU20036.1 metal ABC transporter permease [Enterococcus casseliflavus]